MFRGSGRTVFQPVSMPLSYKVPNSGSSLQCGLLGTETQREASFSLKLCLQLTGSSIILSFSLKENSSSLLGQSDVLLEI